MMGWLDLTPDEWNAVRLSIKVATWAMFASLPVGVAIALLAATLIASSLRGSSASAPG